ncbi:MAG: hypothetical protein P8101_10445 [Candidatus Thiodiazotropha sp.]
MKIGNQKPSITMFALPIVLSIALLGCGGGGGGDDSPASDNNLEESGGNTENDEGVTDTGGDTQSGEDVTDTGGDTQSGEDDTATDEDTEEEEVATDAHPILSNAWAGATCSEYDSGTYFKSLYQFADNGRLLIGLQIYQDAECTTQGEGYEKPQQGEFLSATYSMGTLTTLADGTSGYPIHFEYTVEEPAEPEPPMPEPSDPDELDEDCGDDPDVSQNACATADDADSTDDDSADSGGDDPEVYNDSAEAYVVLKDSQTLCFSQNVYIDSEMFYLDSEADNATMDYEHCLTLFSSVADLPDTSEPVPESDPDALESGLNDFSWLADNLCYPGGDESQSIQRIFEFAPDGLLFNSEFKIFDSADCTGEGFVQTSSWTENLGEYSDLGEETLADGLLGNRIEINNPVIDPSGARVGFYLINQSGQLCVSYNLSMNSNTNTSSTDIDYEHCLQPLDEF